MKLIMTSLLLLISINLQAKELLLGGTEVGNGGDIVSQEFITTGYRIAAALRVNPVQGVSPDEFLMKVATVQVYSKDKVVLNGEEVSAANYPSQNKIYISKKRWKGNRNILHRAYLVFHEYLWMMGIDDTNYRVSHKLVLTQLPSSKDYLRVIANRTTLSLLESDEIDVNYAEYTSAIKHSELDFYTQYQIKDFFTELGLETISYHTVILDGEEVSISKAYRIQLPSEKNTAEIVVIGDYIFNCLDKCEVKQ
jgi:hypothetical protein